MLWEGSVTRWDTAPVPGEEEDYDAYFVASYNHTHVPIAAHALRKGASVLMEKPIAPTYEEGLQLVELAERAGVTFQVGHLERYNAGFMELVKRVGKPRFIEATRIGGFSERATDVDVVMKLLSANPDFFRENPLGSQVFLTMRIPNPTVEQGTRKKVEEALHNVPTSYDLAQQFYGDMKSPPIFEVILWGRRTINPLRQRNAVVIRL